MVNRGEEKVWVQMNVVPRSTGNTNSGTRELTLKCKLKCYFKPIDFGGNRTHDLRIRSTVTLPTELQGRTEKVGDDLGGESRRRESMGTNECCAA